MDHVDLASMMKTVNVSAPRPSLLWNWFAPEVSGGGAAALTSAPFYFRATSSLVTGVPDKYLSLILPIIAYWAFSAVFYTLDILQLPFTERYRLHENEEVTKRNRVSPSKVATMVVIQQIFQTILGIVALGDDDPTGNQSNLAWHVQQVLSWTGSIVNASETLLGPRLATHVLTTVGGPTRVAYWVYWWGIPAVQFAWAFFVMDAWQYVLHRAFHESRFLYRHFHSHHHRLYVPYAFGALYNHPLEGLLFDSAGGALSHAVALMTPRQGILLFTFATIKTVSDHGGYSFPWYIDPLHLVFSNTAAYHDVHHQSAGLKYNYSQPFFIHFDVLFGTRMDVQKWEKLKSEKEKRRLNIDAKEKALPATPVESAISSALPEAAQTTTQRVNAAAS